MRILFEFLISSTKPFENKIQYIILLTTLPILYYQGVVNWKS